MRRLSNVAGEHPLWIGSKEFGHGSPEFRGTVVKRGRMVEQEFVEIIPTQCLLCIGFDLYRGCVMCRPSNRQLDVWGNRPAVVMSKVVVSHC